MTRWLFAVLLAACPVWAQVELNPPRSPSVITVDVNVVNVLCTVRDRKGAFVKDLQKTDFQMREDGKPQEIRYFSREVDTPLTVALMLDVSGSVANILGIEKAAAGRFFDEVLRPTDKALFVGFAQTTAVWQDLTGSKQELSSALDAAGPFVRTPTSEFQPRGGTLLYDAVSLVASQKLARLPGRKTMVIITDGLDNGSLVTVEDAMKAAQQADAVVYAIHYEDQGYSDRYAGAGETALRHIAEPTGGRTFHVSASLPLEAIFDIIREEMRSQYAIGFTSTNTAKDGSYRRLELKTTRSGLKTQAREGYYAPR
ncbi:von Willebrand factor, type A [Candidatus Sulfopaludibacter sp. SbA3]|nr:von Willebrand factor, type A [Candidatus Sulfopaludibacter sp. SbA3]